MGRLNGRLRIRTMGQDGESTDHAAADLESGSYLTEVHGAEG